MATVRICYVKPEVLTSARFFSRRVRKTSPAAAAAAASAAASGINTFSYAHAYTLQPAMLLRTQKAHETPKDVPHDCISSRGATLLTK